MGKTVVIGASNNPDRFSYRAVHKLKEHGIDFVPVGIKKGEVGGKEILPILDRPPVEDVDTVTLYMNPMRQKDFYQYILSLKPRRIIFNPGTENPELESLAAGASIGIVENCTLVMLESGIY